MVDQSIDGGNGDGRVGENVVSFAEELVGEVDLPPPGGPKRRKVSPLIGPAVASNESHDLGLGDHRNAVELEAAEGLARKKPGSSKMACVPALFTLGQPPFASLVREPRSGELDGIKHAALP